MTCPDVDRMIDFALDVGHDPELAAHLESCPECRRTLSLLRAIPSALRPREPLPERLQALAMSAIEGAKEEERERLSRVPALQVVAAGALGFFTAVTVLVASGTAGGAGLPPLLGYSLAVGVGVSIYRTRRGGGAVPAEV